MPEFYAVQCFQCSTFQCQQKRADRTMRCRICGAKQSIRKVFATSAKAKDVRKAVQSLNLARGSAEEEYERDGAGKDSSDGGDDGGTNERSEDPKDRRRGRDADGGARGFTDDTLRGSGPVRESDDEAKENDDVYTTVMPSEVRRKVRIVEGGVRKHQRKHAEKRSVPCTISPPRATKIPEKRSTLSSDQKLEQSRKERLNQLTFTLGGPGSIVEEETIL